MFYCIVEIDRQSLKFMKGIDEFLLNYCQNLLSWVVYQHDLESLYLRIWIFFLQAVSNQIRAYYFGSKEIGKDTAVNLTNLYSDRWFNHATRTAAILHAKKNEAVPVYLYLFSYKGRESHLKFLNITEKLGEHLNSLDQLIYKILGNKSFF